jgi:hypothetical protein
MSKRKKIETTVFNGLMPIISPTILDKDMAQEAQNVDLRSGNLKPYGGSTVEKSGISANAETIYKYRQFDDGASEWLTFDTDVDIAISPINADKYERIFYTGHADGKLHQRGVKSAVAFDRAVYIPPPTTKMTAAIADQFSLSDITCNVTITYDYLDDLMNTYQEIHVIPCIQDEVGDDSISGSRFNGGYYDGDGLSNTASGNASTTFQFPKTDITYHELEAGATTATNTFTVVVVYTIGGVDYDATDLGDSFDLKDDSVPKVTYGTAKIVTITTDSPNQYLGIGGASFSARAYYIQLHLTTQFPSSFHYYYFCTFVNDLGQEGPAIDLLSTPDTVRNNHWATEGVTSLRKFDGDKEVAEPWYRNNPTGQLEGFTGITGPVIRDITDKVTLTALPVPVPADATVTKRRIYRSLLNYSNSGEAKFALVAELDIAETEFVDWDSGNGMTYDERNNPIEDLKGLVAHPNRFLVAFKDDTVYCSDINLPHTWKKYYTTDSPVVGLEVSGTDVIVLTIGTPTILSGVNPFALRMSKMAIQQSCVSKKSICKVGDVVSYASPDGLVFITGGQAEVVTEKFIHPEQWLAYNPSTMVCAQYDGQIFASTSNTNLIFNPNAGENALTTLSQAWDVVYNDLYDDALYFVDGTNIKEFDDDDDNPYLISWKGKEFDYGKPTVFTKCRVIADDYSADIHLFIYVNGVMEQDMLIQSDRVHNLSIRRNEKYWSVKVEGYSNIRRIELGQSTNDFQ